MKITSKDYWWRLELQVYSELVESFIWKLDSLGISRFSFESSPEEISRPILFIWLLASEWTKDQRESLVLSFKPMAKNFGLKLITPLWTKVEEKDWSLNWKKEWKPDPVGNSLLILPEWLALPSHFSDRTILKIDPGSAFGTGSHPTTRLCLESIEKLSLVGLRVADIGSGSGILSLAALRLGAEKVFAVDTDPLAFSATKRNLAKNFSEASNYSVRLGSLDVLKADLSNKPVDLLLCNILAPVIKSLAEGFEDVIAIKGRALLTGLLVDQVKELEEFLEVIGWKVVNSLEKGQWALIEISRSLD